jgi:hypothetical protein
MLLIPEGQVRNQILVESLGAVGEGNDVEAIGVSLRAVDVLASEGLGRIGSADGLAQEGNVRLLSGLEFSERQGREAVGEGGDGVRHFDGLDGVD